MLSFLKKGLKKQAFAALGTLILSAGAPSFIEGAPTTLSPWEKASPLLLETSSEPSKSTSWNHLETGGVNFYGSFEKNEIKRAVQSKKAQMSNLDSWQKFHSVHGKCIVSLPESPEHVKQIMPFPEEGYNLRYDVYVSAHEKQAIYMMLIAQYPPFINESHAEMSLESFLNGLVTQNHDNQLIFADLTEVQGHKALDFFIESKGVYFKGRAIMAQNNLYLLAMECDVNNYLEKNFNYFINSFELIK